LFISNFPRIYIAFTLPDVERDELALIIFDAAVCYDTGTVAIRDDKIQAVLNDFIYRVTTRSFRARLKLVSAMEIDAKEWHNWPEVD
jgi:hypothetical protein